MDSKNNVVFAVKVGRKIDTKKLKFKGFELVNKDPYIFKKDDRSIVAFKYGVVVFWNFDEDEIDLYVSSFKTQIVDRFSEYYTEKIQIESGEGLEFDNDIIYLPELNLEVIQVLSIVLARSVSLEFFELEVEKAVADFTDISKSYEEKGRSNMNTKTLMKKLWFANNVKQLTIGQVTFLDKPDVTWDDDELDNLFNKSSEYYELDDRYEVLKEKLGVIFDNAQFILDMINVQKSHFLEIIIILLILIEVVFYLGEKFF